MSKHHIVHREVDVECIQGVSIELRHALPKGWVLTKASDSFVVRGDLTDGWKDRLWSVVRFVSYTDFLSLRQTQKGASEVRYEMVSASDSGLGFRVEFILTNSN
ncbi:MAG: hypothetical protein ABI134_25970 [Byssovorax sp.]